MMSECMTYLYILYMCPCALNETNHIIILIWFDQNLHVYAKREGA
jgi:hypothetical protein